MYRGALRILAVSSIVVGMAACDGDDDAATSATEVGETTDTSAATDDADTTIPSSATTGSDTTAPTGPQEFETVTASTSWSPVLEGVTASPAPPAAACDTTSPAGPGELELPEFMLEPLGPEPPYSRWFAAFAPTTHSVTVIGQYGDGERAAAGSLDVCTDTWSPVNSVLRHPDTDATGVISAMVYDVDSDAMVAYTSEGVFVHDTELDEWLHHPVPRSDSGLAEPPTLSAAYHPASGMVIVAQFDQLLAHDVDTDEWMPITSRPFVYGASEFLGVEATMDRFVFEVAGTGDDDETTWLADPVSNEAMVVQTPEHTHVNTVWPNEAFGPADDTIFVTRRATGEVCGFDAETLAWNRCVTSSTDAAGLRAIVGDPVNDRLIAISTTTIETWPLP